MRNTKKIKTALRELIQTIKEEMNDSRNSYIEHFMPETGVYTTEEKDCDEDGHWGFILSKHYMDEDECLEKGKEAILEPNNKDWFEEFVEESEIKDKAMAFIRLIAERV